MIFWNFFLGMHTYWQLPFWIKTQIALYYLNRVFSKPTDHQTIWTSFFYFAIKQNVVIQRHENNLFYVTFNADASKLNAYVRGNSSSDIFAFFQVFIANGYQPLIDFLKQNVINPTVIVDAGANVGYFSLLAMQNWNSDKIIALEPEKSNFNQLKRNSESNGFGSKIKLLNAALWTHKKWLSLNFRSGEEWAVRVTDEITDQMCLAYSLKEIMTEAQVIFIDVLKIDVEGTEDALFKDNDFLLMLDYVKVLAIEIHDHLTDRSMICNKLHQHGFSFFDRGELTIAWNNKFVNAI